MILDILVNGQRVDILDRSSVNLRLNNVVYNPTEINSTQAEYSFSFNLPTTPNNNRIFDHANVLAKNNKFQNVYHCEVYSDEILIFDGSLRVQSIKKGFYNVNLVNIKINTVEDIFGEMKLNEVDWKIPFTGADSINTHNEDLASKVIFPLVSYGVFQKKPISTEYDYSNYTSKFLIDQYNKWYYESFNPSANLLEFVKRLFNQKGYNVSGDIFQDKTLNNIYMSTNLADDQVPTYNLGHPNLGQATITTEFSNYTNKNTGDTNSAVFTEHNLSYPYLGFGRETTFNWESVDIYDLWTSSNSKITRQEEHYMFDDFSNCIVIPADGLYKISINTNINLPSQSITAQEQYPATDRSGDLEYLDVTLNNSLIDDMPVEIQLVKNQNECELIHGSLQWSLSRGDRSTKSTWYTAYPHENLYRGSNPTVSTSLYSSGTNTGRYSSSTGDRNSKNDYVGSRADSTSRPSTSGSRPSTSDSARFAGYMPKNGQLLAYDPWVNENFIAGISTIGEGTPSFIKNGYSWNLNASTINNSRYNQNGYYSLSYTGRGNTLTEVWEETQFNKNQLIDAPTSSISVAERSCSGTVSGIVELQRNDILMLKAIARHWTNENGDIFYQFDANVTLTIEAYSPRDINSIEASERTWNSSSEFDYDLQIGNFFNQETKVSDFINNFIKEFNLSYVNDGTDVYLNTQNLSINDYKYCINLDKKVKDSESSLIEFPSYMNVKYKIDTEEWGFETTVPANKLNDADWKDYGDYGSDKVIISDRVDAEGEELQINTSYTYYDSFEVSDQEGQVTGEITIPVISKYQYMIDGYSYEQSMKVDGKGLPMRYWFRGSDTENIVQISGKYPVSVYDTKNTYDGLTLSYKNEPGTLLTKYFNISPNLSSNYLSVKCYLNAEEYQQLKNGANVLFDSDVYIVSEIQGYDAQGINQTELLLIKKN